VNYLGLISSFATRRKFQVTYQNIETQPYNNNTDWIFFEHGEHFTFIEGSILLNLNFVNYKIDAEELTFQRTNKEHEKIARFTSFTIINTSEKGIPLIVKKGTKVFIKEEYLDRYPFTPQISPKRIPDCADYHFVLE